MRSEEVLSLFKETEALLTGHFELRSGLHSDQFFQCAKLLEKRLIAGRLCNALVDKVKERYANQLIDSVVAPAMGGITIGYDVARIMNKRFIFVEKQENKLALRRFSIRPGEKFIIAEDVITRGGRVDETIEIIEAAGGEVVAVAVLVDRSGGRANFGVPHVSLLEMEPVTYEPDNCPLCAQGLPLVHPGS